MHVTSGREIFLGIYPFMAGVTQTRIALPTDSLLGRLVWALSIGWRGTVRPPFRVRGAFEGRHETATGESRHSAVRFKRKVTLSSENNLRGKINEQTGSVSCRSFESGGKKR